jgi:hypothetical protein
MGDPRCAAGRSAVVSDQAALGGRAPLDGVPVVEHPWHAGAGDGFGDRSVAMCDARRRFLLGRGDPGCVTRATGRSNGNIFEYC